MLKLRVDCIATIIGGVARVVSDCHFNKETPPSIDELWELTVLEFINALKAVKELSCTFIKECLEEDYQSIIKNEKEVRDLIKKTIVEIEQRLKKRIEWEERLQKKVENFNNN